MERKSHIAVWLEGMQRAEIKRWLSQKCIGYQINYQVNGDQIQLSVFTGQAELEDGTIKEVWFLQYPYGESVTPRRSPYIFEQPRVDIPQKEE